MWLKYAIWIITYGPIVAKQLFKLYNIALEVVKSFKDSNLDNTQRAHEAYVRIRDLALDEGIKDPKDNLVNLARELAVLHIKKG